MKYQVIIILDSSRNRSYYQGYIISDDETQGNITCEELPPYADVNKARSCYWDSEEKSGFMMLKKKLKYKNKLLQQRQKLKKLRQRQKLHRLIWIWQMLS